MAVLAVGTAALSSAQLPLEPSKDKGQAIYAAYEGWFKNDDGSYSLLIGYFNRNHEQVVDIPIGPDNRIEPGDVDRGQPTHFLPRRNWGVFTVRVPADFGGKKLTWHLVANDQPTEIPMGLNPLWEVEPLRDAAQGNTPPSMKFAPDGAPFQGPPVKTAAEYEATTSDPLTITVWASDDGVVDEYRRARAIDPPVRLTWSKYRGPGDVEFDNETPDVSKDDGRSDVTVTFTEPGDYVLRLQANDVSGNGGGGAQCCWSNAHVTVKVTAGASSQ